MKTFYCLKNSLKINKLNLVNIGSADDRRQFFDSKGIPSFAGYGANSMNYGKNMRLDETATVMRNWANNQKIPNLNQYNLGPNLNHRPKVYNNIYKSQYSTVYSNIAPNYNNTKYY